MSSTKLRSFPLSVLPQTPQDSEVEFFVTPLTLGDEFMLHNPVKVLKASAFRLENWPLQLLISLLIIAGVQALNPSDDPQH